MTILEKMLKLNTYIHSGNIKQYISDINLLKTKLDKEISDIEKERIVNSIKDAIHKEANKALSIAQNWGSVYMATGTGKTKMAIMKISNLLAHNYKAKVLVVVPTIRLRDNGWKEECIKWYSDGQVVWDNSITIECYASLAKIKDKHYDLVILDEGHNLNENNSIFFKNNKVDNCILMTATQPNKERMKILISLKLNAVYSITVDEATLLGIIAPYEITIVTVPLDDKDEYITVGSKIKGYRQTTEMKNYLYLTNNRFRGYMGLIKRMQFIGSLKSKTEATKYILSLIPDTLRTLIFCGSKKQANEVCPYRHYSKPSPPSKKKLQEKATENAYNKYNEELEQYNRDIFIYNNTVVNMLDRFIDEEINKLSCVEALNEGQNLPNIDIGLVAQLNSKQLTFIQRLGRIIRYRVGHTGKIIIVCASETEDWNWVKKALKGLDMSKIRYISLEDLKNGKESLNL